MNTSAKNILTAFCCTAMLTAIGCSSTGELSITGMYDQQGKALSGDQCDELLMEAADADTAEGQEAAREAYRECVEQALHEDGQNGECRDNDDATCDIILEEIGDTLHRLREQNNQTEPPRCDAPQSSGEVALCHLIAAYEACELDRDNDGDPDVEPCADGSENCGPAPGECDEADANCRPEECNTQDGRCEEVPPPGCDPADPNTDCAPQPGECTNADGERCDSNDPTEPHDQKSCDEVRQIAEQSGEEDREFWHRERPECFDNTTPGTEDGNDPTAEFCANLLQELEQATTDAEAAELREIYERECVN